MWPLGRADDRPARGTVLTFAGRSRNGSACPLCPTAPKRDDHRPRLLPCEDLNSETHSVLKPRISGFGAVGSTLGGAKEERLMKRDL